MLQEQSRSLASGLGLFSFIKGGGGIMDFAVFYRVDRCRGEHVGLFAHPVSCPALAEWQRWGMEG